MKKRDLEKELKRIANEAGFELEFVGGTKHDKFRINGSMVLVPRHKEINEITTQKIIKDLQKAIE